MTTNPETSYSLAISNIFDCALLVGREGNQPFQEFGKFYQNLRKHTREDVLHDVFDKPQMKRALKEIKESTIGFVKKFNEENGVELTSYAGLHTRDPHDDYTAFLNCGIEMPEPMKVKGGTTLYYPSGNPPVRIKIEKRVDTNLSKMLRTLENLNGIGITEFSAETTYSEANRTRSTIPVKAFFGRSLWKNLDSSIVKIELERKKPQNFNSVIQCCSEGTVGVKLEYNDKGKMIKAKPEEVKVEKEWLEKAVESLTNS